MEFRINHGRTRSSSVRRLRALVIGSAIILVGIVISPLPGPGLSVLGALGLAILASEFVWARRLKIELRQRSGPARARLQRVARATPRWVVLPVCAGYWGAMAALAAWGSVPPMVLWPAASILFAPVFLWAYLVWRTPR